MFSRKIKSFLRDYFTLTSRERKGALVLAGIIIIQILIIIRMHYLTVPSEPALTVYRMQIEKFENNIETARSHEAFPYKDEQVTTKEPKLFPFDPNTITDMQWGELGLSSKQTAVIRNYLRKGGRFRNKESLSRIYIITPEQYRRMEPFIIITDTSYLSGKLRKKSEFTKKEIPVIELNSADTTRLAELPQVGQGRARMIYRYRERLGGFVEKQQLLEVFTIDSAVYSAISPFCRVDERNIRKININSDSLYHPYLNKQTAKVIIAYRKQHGNFSDINGLRKVTLIDEQILRKLVPYIAFE